MSTTRLVQIVKFLGQRSFCNFRFSKYAKGRTEYNYEYYYYEENTNLLNSVGCRGTELSLFDCSSDSGYCDEYNIAAVDCA